jgi:hypothetical protein
MICIHIFFNVVIPFLKIQLISFLLFLDFLKKD